MKLSEVPVYPAYLVCHDLYDNGAMDVYPMTDIESAKRLAKDKQRDCDEMSIDGARWEAYTKLPRRRIHRFHK